MRSLSPRLLLSLFLLLAPSALLAHSVTVSGTNSFASLDGSSLDHDGVANGVFTVSDGDLTIAGTVNCNDDGGGDSACSMSFSASGDITVSGSLFAENRTGGGTGGAITLSAGRDLILTSTALVSTSSKSSSGATGGNITANVARNVSLASGSTIDAGSSNAKGGKITVAAGGAVSVDGNVLSGPSRTILATRLTGAALDGGTANQVGGEIKISSSTFAEPAVSIGSNANVISQGETTGAGPVVIEGCGISVKGLVAALSRKDSPAKVSIRSGKDLVVDARDLGVTGATLGRLGRVRADAPSGTAVSHTLELLAAETIDILGPNSASSTSFPLSALAGANDSKSVGGLIRVVSTGDVVNGSGNVADDGRSSAGDTGGPIDIAAKGNVNLNTAVIRTFGDSSTNNPARGGGSIAVRSYSGNVVWTNGLGDVRPTGSASSLPLADQGTITLTACGTVTTTGSSFPVNGSPTGVWPVVTTGTCSPAAPSLPSGVVLVTCNTPPVANDVTASTNEDNSVTITLSGTDADGDPLTFSIVSGPSNGSLGSIIQLTPTSASVTYSPNANYNGGDSFVYQANDGNGGTDNATVTITIVAVNDAPSFLAGPTATSLEDAGPQTYPNWATSISAGPADESGQTVTFTVTNSNPALFSVQPAVSSNGTLTYTAAPNANGTATLTVVAHDNGGTANGGVDTSASQTSTISITAVNDAPSFTKGADQTVAEDAGPQTVAGWATGISAGPNESGQSVSFNVSNSNLALFSVQPAVSPSGTLTYTPAANANGSATVTVTLSDDGGTANGGVDTSAPQTFTITITAVNDAPSFTKGPDVTVLEDSGAASFPGWATAISAGPADESGQTVSFIVSASDPSLFSSFPVVSSTGDLSFTPAPNKFGSTVVTITAQDNGVPPASSASQTFTITITGVNDAPSFTAGGDVTVNEDSGAYSAAWATSISAGPNEGAQTVAFNVSNGNPSLFSVQPAISPSGILTFTPALNASGSALVTVSLSDNGGTANGGVDTSGTVTFTIFVNAVNDPPIAGNDAYETVGNTQLQVAASKTVTDPSVFVTGSVLSNDTDVDSGSLTASLGSVTAGAIVTMNPDGTFTYQPPAGHPSATDTFTYTVSDGSASSSGTVTITLKGRVWYVRNNTGAGAGRSHDPFATLAAAEAASVANDTIFIFTGNGTVLNQNAGFALQNGQRLLGQGVALTVPVSVNGGANPTVLLAAGTKPKISNAGGDGVTGSGVSNVTVAGLEVIGSSADGIKLVNASGVTVDTVFITGNLGNGIAGNVVSNFSLSNAIVDGNGDSAALLESGISFIQLTGTAQISSTTVKNSVRDNVRIVNSTGVLNRVTFNNVTFGPVNSATGEDGLFIQNGGGTLNTTITNSFFTAARSDLFQLSLVGNGSADLVMTANAFSNNQPSILSGGGGVVIGSGGGTNPTLTFDIRQNTFRDANGTALLVLRGSGAGSYTGKIDSNTIGVSGVNHSASVQGSGIDVTMVGGGSVTVAVTNNTIFQYENYGIFLQAGNAASGGQGSMNATVTGNTVSQPASASFLQNGFQLNAGVSSAAPQDAHNVCLNLSGNNLVGSGANGGTDFRLRQRFLTTVKLPGYAGANNDNAAVVAFVQANNPGAETGAAANTVSTGGGGYVGGAPCVTP